MQVRTRIITTLGAGGLIAGLAATATLASAHTAQAGDTLSGVAAHTGVTLGRAEAGNPRIVDPNAITVGDDLTLPDGHRLGHAAGPGHTRGGTHTHAHTHAHTHTHAHQRDHGRSRAAAAASASQAAAPAGSAVSAPSSFQQCVAWRESSDTATDPDGLYGILPSTWASLGYSGTAGEAPVALQNEAFQRLYAQYGTQPWAPSDGC